MEKIKILPQTIFKYKCDSELLSDTLEMIKDEEWKSNDQIEYIGQTYNCLLNRQSKYQKLYEDLLKLVEEHYGKPASITEIVDSEELQDKAFEFIQNR